MKITIDPDTCKKCGRCAKVCFTRKIVYEKKEVPKIIPDRSCMGCGHCVAICPTQSVMFDGKKAVIPSEPKPTPESVETLIKMRRSIRAYKPTPVPRETLTSIARTTMSTAPTACNSQRTRVSIVYSRAIVEQVVKRTIDFFASTGAPVFQPFVDALAAGEDRVSYGAPHLVCFYSECKRMPFGPDSRETALFDLGIASQTFDTLANAHGLGTCYVGFIKGASEHDPEIRRLLGIPEGAWFEGCMTIGEPALKYVNECPRPCVDPVFIE
eukprot:gnl/Chilomastix_cuspidata/676.p2 GENE.gnl/Chilomastix_cuspidata/676~~gnl/Chilomastix_cuspidata/676.p2  ORF type:complete len:269 (-),score=98.02 gnl/Chilomastix_cuspidata/676:15-821(-)